MDTPLQDVLERLHGSFAGVDAGEVATYIPELARANPAHFAVACATVDGHVYAVGDAGEAFTIQSISKPFVYGLALDDLGVEAVAAKVGVEPSGEAFNAISLEPATGRPRNPMINAGAIATASLVRGAESDDQMARVLAMMTGFAGRTLDLDMEVYRSERDTGHRNRAIAYLLRNAGIVGDDVDAVLESFLRALGVAPDQIPADQPGRLHRYRELTRRRAMLVVLDNVASADEVSTLLPTGAGSLALVTSRRRLVELTANYGAWPIVPRRVSPEADRQV